MSAAAVLEPGINGLTAPITAFPLVAPQDKSRRATRRRFVARRNRGVRPTDPVELKTTQWYTETVDLRTRLGIGHDDRQSLLETVHRRDVLDDLDPEGLLDLAAITEVVAEAQESDIALEGAPYMPTAVVIMPTVGSFANFGLDDDSDDVNPEILAIFTEDAPIVADVAADALHSINNVPRHIVRQRLSRTAEDEFDPTDGEHDPLSGEPLFLRA